MVLIRATYIGTNVAEYFNFFLKKARDLLYFRLFSRHSTAEPQWHSTTYEL
jgi:hypothetical protein